MEKGSERLNKLINKEKSEWNLVLEKSNNRRSENVPDSG